MKSVFEKKYEESFGGPSVSEPHSTRSDAPVDSRAEIDAILAQAHTLLASGDENVASEDTEGDSAEVVASDAVHASDSAERFSVSTVPEHIEERHSRLSTYLPSAVTRAGAWKGLLAAFLVGAVFGASGVYLTMSAQPPKTVVKEKIVNKTEIVYRDVPLAAQDDTASSLKASEVDSSVSAHGRKKGNGTAVRERRADRKEQLLASLADGGKVGSSAVSNGAGAGLSQQQLRTVVDRNRSGLQLCYERELKKGTASSFQDVKVVFSVGVGKSGTVTRVSTSGSGAKIPELNRCMTTAVKRWVFPTSGGASDVQFPIVFTPSR